MLGFIQFGSLLFGIDASSDSDVSERFKESISRFLTNFKKINESRIFDLSRDPIYHRAKISHFQNMLGFIQYGSLLFGIDGGGGGQWRNGEFDK